MATNKLLLVTETGNIAILEEFYQSMDKDGYFENIEFELEVTLPSSYPESQNDKKVLSEEGGFSDAAVARTFTTGTRRILFFDAFFEKGETQKKIFMLHELAHRIIYDSGVNNELYSKATEIRNVRLNLSDERMKSKFEHMANKQIGYILSLPDEILAEKVMYNKWPDLFHERMLDYLEGDKANIEELINNIALEKAGNLDLQKIINRILFIRSVYSFYDGESKDEHLLLTEKFDDCIKKITSNMGFECGFIFEYIDEIISECLKERIDSEKLIELFLSYRKDFLEKIFNYQFES